VSATPEQIAAELGGMFMRLATETEDDAAMRRIETARAAAALIRAQADALILITEMDGDQPARSDWDMVRIARAALKAAP
jgi:hypothetical protein